MNKKLLEILMPAGLAVVALAICFCLIILGDTLSNPTPEYAPPVAAADSLQAEFTDTPVEQAQSLPSGANAAAIAAGDALFKGNCAQCHAVNEVVVGPALAGITKRRPMSWITSWVKNSSKLVASGDEYALKVFEQYQKQQMPSFQLSDAEITSIIAYIDSRQAEGMARAGTNDVAYVPGEIIACQ
jgi:mono/diheme cytochrome c family protein